MPTDDHRVSRRKPLPATMCALGSLLVFGLLTACTTAPETPATGNSPHALRLPTAQEIIDGVEPRFDVLVDEESGEVVAPPDYYEPAPQSSLDEDFSDWVTGVTPQPQVGDLPPSDFPLVWNEQVELWIEYFTQNKTGRKFFRRALARSGRYKDFMSNELAALGLPRDLVYLSLIESGFNPRAYSRSHASGPWQFIRSTGRRYGLHNDWSIDERCDPIKSTRAAAAYLKDLHELFDDWYLAIAAYNAGEGKLGRAIKKYGTRDFWEIAKGRYLRRETKRYVPKMIASIIIAKYPGVYGFGDVVDEPAYVFETVSVPGGSDLKAAAKAAKMSYDQLRELNPHLKTWYAPPNRKMVEVRVPPGHAEGFAAAYKALPPSRKTTFHRHKLRYGETLSHLADYYRTSIRAIMELNGINNPRRIRAGQRLLIPIQIGKTAPGEPKRSLAQRSAPVASGQVRPPKNITPEDAEKRHRQIVQVRRGDTLWDIAQACYVRDYQLREWNGLTRRSRIYPGQQLNIWPLHGYQCSGAVAVVKGGSTAVAQARESKPATSGARTHTVRRGDTLWDIAQAYGVSVSALKKANSLGRSNKLMPGQELRIP